jgi:hypothetical protein
MLAGSIDWPHRAGDFNNIFAKVFAPELLNIGQFVTVL